MDILFRSIFLKLIPCPEKQDMEEGMEEMMDKRGQLSDLRPWFYSIIPDTDVIQGYSVHLMVLATGIETDLTGNRTGPTNGQQGTSTPLSGKHMFTTCFMFIFCGPHGLPQLFLSAPLSSQACPHLHMAHYVSQPLISPQREKSDWLLDTHGLADLESDAFICGQWEWDHLGQQNL